MDAGAAFSAMSVEDANRFGLHRRLFKKIIRLVIATGAHVQVHSLLQHPVLGDLNFLVSETSVTTLVGMDLFSRLKPKIFQKSSQLTIQDGVTWSPDVPLMCCSTGVNTPMVVLQQRRVSCASENGPIQVASPALQALLQKQQTICEAHGCPQPRSADFDSRPMDEATPAVVTRRRRDGPEKAAILAEVQQLQADRKINPSHTLFAAPVCCVARRMVKW
jgi:hypothetical protein